MARPSASRALGVWANGRRVGQWLLPTSGPTEFSYDAGWVESQEGRPISLSLPINLDGQPLKGEKVNSFFDNLLPDSEGIRQRIRSRYSTRSASAFDLLEAIGRDCVGALQLLPEGKVPQGVTTIDVTALSDGEIERLLIGTVSEPVRVAGEEEDFRISIAGAQEKTALTWHDGRWCKPHGATPTTHIFKLPLGLVGGRKMDMTASLENEWLCAQLLAAYGMPVASCEVKQFGATKALVVSRFDRHLHPSKRYWLRLPQEDFCQATGTPSSQKYESDGGPGLAEISRVLQGSEERENDLATLLRAQLLFWMLAATDGHGKNFSIRLLAQGRYRLTPLYDVLSAWPITGPRHNQVHLKKLKLAMSLRGTKTKHYRVEEMNRRLFNLTARQCGLGSDMESIITDVLTTTPEVIKRVERRLPKGFPADLFESMTTGLRKAATQLAAMPATPG
ncbi:MAG TPA: type II toxin-antitoxin system HipA family toxin [Polyangiaceae bacterium]|jgi:serine/threonine-protein kinase HipA|nr:type II toxin-antitoxin system HipA family toxin [Polyangiaceae bacterium]